MNTIKTKTFDIIVVGAGHAGCEAALASARLGNNTLCLSISLDGVAIMACNPSVGGTSKGHLVREIDALGGQMGINIDKTSIQMKMLNLSKGPAVHSLRAQADKKDYHEEMKSTLEKTDNLLLKQDEAVSLIVEDGEIKGVKTSIGFTYYSKAVVLCTGVYLQGKIIIGEYTKSQGPSGLAGANELTNSLIENGIEVARFKTGTPARVDLRTLDLSQMEIQEGQDDIYNFSFLDIENNRKVSPCYLTWTNEKTHDIIRNNLHRSPLYCGDIEGTGPRYCPSIEDKVVRFADKERHQVFIEPESQSTNEMYVQGMSTSLPIDVQIAMLRTIKGMENVEIMRAGYAIEYDCINPTQLDSSLMFKNIKGLFAAGQINGSSGYEEAAAQGLMAGINASQYINNKEPLVLSRSDAYIGVLIDDLVTKGTNEPYRMMTSRAEHRLLLRQDNADLRLTKTGYEIGLAGKERYDLMLRKQREVAEIIETLDKAKLPPKDLTALFEDCNETLPAHAISLKDTLKRVNITLDMLSEHSLFDSSNYMKDSLFQAQIQIKYEGYIGRQALQVHKQKRMESFLIDNIDFLSLKGLRKEAAQKLNEIKPKNIGQASRISGVSPADIGVLLIYLEKERQLK
ncbi:MAG: tRNA uridine-5-carboxymethylaminomethyl(34) synthesis enzyme MnmG [Clostridia bacterium]|nr:tRNA uridine-5-carboxymethylaminomethyl(34) synthesis enzyme MnmG [Clostridia bacterium]